MKANDIYIPFSFSMMNTNPAIRVGSLKPNEVEKKKKKKKSLWKRVGLKSNLKPNQRTRRSLRSSGRLFRNSKRKAKREKKKWSEPLKEAEIEVAKEEISSAISLKELENTAVEFKDDEESTEKTDPTPENKKRRSPLEKLSAIKRNTFKKRSSKEKKLNTPNLDSLNFTKEFTFNLNQKINIVNDVQITQYNNGVLLKKYLTPDLSFSEFNFDEEIGGATNNAEYTYATPVKPFPMTLQTYRNPTKESLQRIEEEEEQRKSSDVEHEYSSSMSMYIHAKPKTFYIRHRDITLKTPVSSSNIDSPTNNNISTFKPPTFKSYLNTLNNDKMQKNKFKTKFITDDNARVEPGAFFV